MPPILECLGVCSKKTGVNCVNNWGGSDHPAAKVSAVQALDGILASRYLVEFEVDVTLGVGVNRYVDYVSILGLRFLADIVL